MNNVIDLTQQLTTVDGLIRHLQDFHHPNDFIAYNAIKVENVIKWAAEINIPISARDARGIVCDFPDYAPDIKDVVQTHISSSEDLLILK